MKKLLSIVSFALVASACQTPNTPLKPQKTASTPDFSAVTIVHNGSIYTVDKAQPKVEAFAYQGDKIIALGSTDSLFNRFPNSIKNDLKGATVVPGLIDAHGHLLGLGQGLMNTDLMGTRSKAEIIDRLKLQADTLINGQWLLGRGWDQNDWPIKELPTAADLDRHFPDRPVWLERVDGHANWGNSLAMSAASKNLNGDWQPEGGEVVRDIHKVATGVFIDNAVNLIKKHVPTATDAEMEEALNRAMSKTASVGLTAMHDAGTSLHTWTLLQQKQADTTLNNRVYAMADGASNMLENLCTEGPVIDQTSMLTARSVKLYSDGALGSRGAALLAPYSDAPNNIGLLIESEETLQRHADKASKCGLQVNIHAIGDRGNRVTLNVLDSIKTNSNPGRHRIEHSQVIAPPDFERCQELNLIA